MSAPEIDLFVMAAMHEEIVTLKANSKLISIIQSPKGRWQIRRLKNGRHIALSVCGISARKADALIAKAATQHSMKELIVAGCCGGLEPQMKFDTTIIAESFVDAKDTRSIKTSERLNAKISEILPEGIFGAMAFSDILLETVEQKLDCLNRCGAKIVEMEGLAIAESAQKHNVEIASVRWVLDGEDENIYDNTLTKSQENTLNSLEIRKRLAKISDNIAAFVEKLAEMM